LKIIRAIIENYKCHKKSVVEFTKFHVLIGSNNSGKTSIIDAFELIKKYLWKEVDIHTKIFGAISGRQLKDVAFTIDLELSEDEREKYSTDFGLLNIYTSKIKPTSFLQKVSLKFSASYAMDKDDSPLKNRLIPSAISVLGIHGTYIPILETLADYKIRFRTFPRLDPGYLTDNKMSIDEYFGKQSGDTQTATLEQYIQKNVGVQQVVIIDDFLNLLEFIPTNREIIKSAPLRTLKPEQVTDRRNDLLQIIYRARSKDREMFDKIVALCKLIHPEIVGLDNNITEDSQITLSVSKKNLLTFLSEQGSGFQNIIYFVWYISLSKQGTIWFIDEPELHLHPSAQSYLYDFFVEETKGENNRQIIVSSQSMIFVHKSDPTEITLTSIAETTNEARAISLKSLVEAEKNLDKDSEPESIRSHIYKVLGYDPTYSLEPRTIVLVEGKADKGVISEFAKVLGKPLDRRSIQIIPVQDKSRVKRFSPYMGRAAIGKKILIILDNDNDSQEDTKNQIIKDDIEYSKFLGITNLLTDQNFFFFPAYVYSIEYFLLNADAICKTANKTDPDIREKVKNEINAVLEKGKVDKPKDVVERIWSSILLMGDYDAVETAIQIAANMTKESLEGHEQILRLIDAIEA
jgi:predicted ATP-dependent endonuclease of OLD family